MASIIKEFREFFTRHSAVTSGSKADKEGAFPTQYYVGSTLVYNRFLKDDYPSADVFSKLFNSLTFKLNIEDSATETDQGLVRVATDGEAIARTDSTIGSAFSRVVRPSQLPNIVSQATGSVVTTIDENGIRATERTVTSGGRTKTSFGFIALVSKSITFNTKNIELVGDAATPGNTYYYGTNGAGTKAWYDLAALITTSVGSAVTAITYTYNTSVKKVASNIQLENDTASPGNNFFFGTDGAGTKGWQNLATYVGGLLAARVPAGTIVMWNGTSAPSGWYLCDGTNGTPDLRGRFIVSIGQNQLPTAGDSNPTYALGDKTGGQTEHILTIAEMPVHKHDVALYSNTNIMTGDVGTYNIGTGTAAAIGGETIGVTESNKGSGTAHNNRPPFYALAYIMKS